MLKIIDSPQLHTFRKGLVWAVSLTFLVIVLGAAVRVAEAGVSCPDWPKCYGQWFPFPAPEGGFIAEGVQYSTLQVFLEWVHRLLAAVVGVFVVVSMVRAVKLKSINSRFVPLGVLSVFTLISQVKLGGITVWLDNVNWSVALHLGNALIFYTMLMLLLMATLRPAKSAGVRNVPMQTKVLIWLSPLMVFLTMLIGAMVSTAYGGGVCGGLFSCVGSWWPEDSLEVLHMLHRYSAGLTFLTACALFIATKPFAALRKTGRIFLIFTAVQAGLGVLTLYSFSDYAWAYQVLSVVHLGWGTVLYTVGVTAVVKLYWGEKDPNLKTLPGHP